MLGKDGGWGVRVKETGRVMHWQFWKAKEYGGLVPYTGTGVILHT